MPRNPLPRPVPAEPDCPSWCVEHYDGADGFRNHSSEPLSVAAADVWTGRRIELGVWMERRDNQADGSTETVGVLEVRPINDDIELTPAAMRELARKLTSYADRAEEGPQG